MADKSLTLGSQKVVLWTLKLNTSNFVPVENLVLQIILLLQNGGLKLLSISSDKPALGFILAKNYVGFSGLRNLVFLLGIILVNLLTFIIVLISRLVVLH